MIVGIALLILIIYTLGFKNLKWGCIIATLFFVTINYSSQNNLYSLELKNTLLLTVEVGLLLLGSICYYEVLYKNKRLEFIQELVKRSPGKPFILVLLSMFLGSFFEGVAGFGIPAMLIIPLLLNAGFHPRTAIICGFTGNFFAVNFGALGTPIIIGLGITSTNEITKTLPILNLLSILSWPFVLTFLISRFEKIKIDWKSEFPHLLGGGILYFTIFWYSSQYFIEFVSVITGMTGLLFYMILFNPQIKSFTLKFWIQSFAPYLLLLVVLLSAKYFLHSQSFQIWQEARSISLFQPGLLFLLSLLILFYSYKITNKLFEINEGVKAALIKLKSSIVNLFLIILFSQMIKEDVSIEIGRVVEKIPLYWTGPIYNALGIGGAFITGSATMTNLLFKDLLSMSNMTFLATTTLAVGGALGNIVSLQNIVLAKSVAPINISEKDILSVTFFLVVLNWIFYQIMILFL
jgi:L-lactate permease